MAECLLDIGAHIGYYSVLAAKIVGIEGKVFAFEPELSNYQKILENISLNNLNNISLFNLAAGSETKQTQLFFNQDNDGGHALWDVVQQLIIRVCVWKVFLLFVGDRRQEK
ncbi:MAG: FkbM family methyltransferase [Okeania sp. SIO3H1]|uniref:FkbM family methyltransferase n=1 Tax=Okeania sp. SIO1I7 TaxID=2607772 RepID=UPI0013C6C50D|nr:FkbM family methyltransferase [Okeania sp. SIO1I7]NEN92482.1 FkbM family methyltransferase [Okeania sp. SIO3H1]NET26590.1 FkbM family methyltransferase [Okeania sp. SIO1I7]